MSKVIKIDLRYYKLEHEKKMLMTFKKLGFIIKPIGERTYNNKKYALFTDDEECIEIVKYFAENDLVQLID